MAQPTIACLDLEGVLVPEIWINVAERTGIAALRRTTRDEPDYDKLMRGRIAILDEHELGLPDIQAVIGGMAPLDGALEFLDWLRSRTQVIILSDTFAGGRKRMPASAVFSIVVSLYESPAATMRNAIERSASTARRFPSSMRRR